MTEKETEDRLADEMMHWYGRDQKRFEQAREAYANARFKRRFGYLDEEKHEQEAFDPNGG